MEMLYLLIAFVIGGVVGGVIIGMWHRANSQGGDEALRIELAKLQSEKEAQADKEEWIKNAEEKLREAFDSLAGKSLRHNADAFLKQAHTQMTNVLNEVRGDWKTQKDEQVSGDSGRPDMIVHLPGGGVLPVDAKTPMTAYLNAAEAGDDAAFGKPFCVYCRDKETMIEIAVPMLASNTVTSKPNIHRVFCRASTRISRNSCSMLPSRSLICAWTASREATRVSMVGICMMNLPSRVVWWLLCLSIAVCRATIRGLYILAS